MTTLGTDSTPPLLAPAGFGGKPGECPECAHHYELGYDRLGAAVRRLVGMRPRPASCPVGELDYSGLAPLPCGCRNPFHGS